MSSIDLEELLDTLSRTKLKTLMVILDACRNNPFGDRIPVKQKGLAQPQLPPHTLVVYSTAPGETATDEGEGNGIFIQTLVKNMSSTNISVETLLKTVRSEVMQATDDKQVPWDSSTLTERFILVKDFAPGANQSNQELRDRAADLFWESIVSKPDLTNLEEFLSRFETSKHATQAKKMLTNLYSQGDKQIAAAKLDFESSQQVRENWLRQISLLKSQQPKSLNLIKLVTVLAPQLAAEDKSAFDQFEAVLRRKPYHTAIAVSFAQEGVVVNVQHSQSSSSVAKGEALKLCEYQRKGVGDRWPIVCKTVYEDGDWHLSAFVAHFSEMAAIDSAFMFKQVAEELRKLAPRIQGSK